MQRKYPINCPQKKSRRHTLAGTEDLWHDGGVGIWEENGVYCCV